MVDLSIIIVNYYNEEYIYQCLKSLIDFHPTHFLEVIIVNNGGVLNKVKTTFSHIIKVYEVSENKGFAYANNIGLNYAQGKYILFLNPDTYFIEPVLETCIEFLEKDSSIGMLGCRLLNPDGSLQLSYHDGHQVFRKLFYRNPFIIKYFNGSVKAQKSMEKIMKQHASSHDAPWLSGAFLMCRKEYIDKYKLNWDEDFFMYWEDVDLCYRTRKCKLKVWYLASKSIIHIGGSGMNVSIQRFEMLENGKLMFIEKHWGALAKFLYILCMKIELIIERLINRKDLIYNVDKVMHLKKEIDFYAKKS